MLPADSTACPILNILRQLPRGTLLLDAAGNVVGLDSRALASDVGRALLGRNYLEALDGLACAYAEAPRKLAARLGDLLRSGGADFSVDHICQQKDVERAFHIAAARIEGRDGPRVVFSYEDVTERARTERDLRLLRYAVDRAAEAFFWVDPDGLFDDVNETACRLTGYLREQILSMRVPDLNPNFTPESWPAHWEETRRRGVTTLESIIRTRDGRLVPVEITINFVKSDEREFHLSLVRDISERKRLEEEVRQSQKLEAIGRLAGGVAHDFNNLLTVINGYSKLLTERTPMEDPNQVLLHEIVEAGRRAADLTRQLLTFSRKQLIQPVVLDLNDLLARMDKMLRRLIGEDIQLQIVPCGERASVKADPGHLEQVVMNLCLNARDAMPDGGRLTIETARVRLDEERSRQYLNLRAGPHVMLTIRDTGCGMTPEVRSHLFEPFFTTKEQGKGTGLGLSTVHGIIQQTGGCITCETEVGKGTTFRILFPEAAKSGDTTAMMIPAIRPHIGHETVLVAEDEANVRALVRAILAGAGYTILEAPDGSEALKIGESHAGPIDLLLTDMVMPNMTGSELARLLSPKRPDMRILFMSGYVDKAVAGDDSLTAGRQFIQKPFSPEALVRKVRETLDRRKK